MAKPKSNSQDYITQSNFVRTLIQNLGKQEHLTIPRDEEIPKVIVQFWDDHDRMPNDVRECLQTWKSIEASGIRRLLFDKRSAGEFILTNLGNRYKAAFDRCYHPAMQSDLFRLCYIFIEGGCYIDADDVNMGSKMLPLFKDGRLKIQPLCYDTAKNAMVPPNIFTKRRAKENQWIFYFNNNPLIARKRHIIIELALEHAVEALMRASENCFPEIQSTTGPGNLTKSIVDAIVGSRDVEHTILILPEWEEIAKSKWPLDYRNDARNWRNANCQAFKVEKIS